MFSTDSTHIRDISGRTMVLDRIAALEAALVQIIEIASPALDDFTSANQRENSVARTKILDIVSRLGLADRVWGNPAEAEEAVS